MLSYGTHLDRNSLYSGPLSSPISTHGLDPRAEKNAA